MKKFIVVALALFLAVPAISFAGSATSRWDVTIGGMVKFDMGYADQAQGADFIIAQPESRGAVENLYDEYNNLFMASGESRINILVQGPDGWGAKTMAFIEGDFRGSSGGTGENYGAFALRHSYMKFTWANDALTIGQTWQKWGLLPSFGGVLQSYSMLAPYVKGSRQPQIMWDHNFNKNVFLALGVIAPNNTLGTSGNTRVDNYSVSPYPFGEWEIGYTSDACGKIGPWQLLASLSGFYGKSKAIFVDAGFDANGNPYQRYTDKNKDAWGMAFKTFIPLVPEKKGDKGGAWSISGIAFANQNPSWYQPVGPGLATIYYARNDRSIAANLQVGAWGQMSYFFTNNVSINGWYGWMENKMSRRYFEAINRGAIDSQQEIIVNLVYDLNPAVRFAVEYDRIDTKWGTYQGYYDKRGAFNAVRVGATYFF